MYAKLLYWEVINFMSIEKGRCEFDDTNIINLKGYNDSGKSAMLNALKVLLYNANPSKQVSFIQDNKDYFRVLGVFGDGVMILRDKYINGQSLYEMYKDNQLIYTTKVNGVLTKVTEVPKPIADYLGLIIFDNQCLNARACFEKQIGVQTTGSENYEMFNVVLKSEEIAVASSLLNNDKNKLASDIESVDYMLQAKKECLGSKSNLTEEMIQYLKEHDNNLDTQLQVENSLTQIKGTRDSLSGVVIPPEVPLVDSARITNLHNIASTSTELSKITIQPQVPLVDSARLTALSQIKTIKDIQSGVVIPPEVPDLESKMFNALSKIKTMHTSLDTVNNNIKVIDDNLKSLADEASSLQSELELSGVKLVRCPNCNELINIG